jgi:hypothetical protein
MNTLTRDGSLAALAVAALAVLVTGLAFAGHGWCW